MRPYATIEAINESEEALVVQNLYEKALAASREHNNGKQEINFTIGYFRTDIKWLLWNLELTPKQMDLLNKIGLEALDRIQAIEKAITQKIASEVEEEWSSVDPDEWIPEEVHPYDYQSKY